MTTAEPFASPLPPLYAGWMDACLGAPIPAETEATCGECALCPQDGRMPVTTTEVFNPATKCCTYVPELPNFLVGRILTDDDPALASGRESVLARLHAGVAVTPLGIGRNPAYTLAFRHSPGAFGQAESLRCPHYRTDLGGVCGIWRHRDATCATWHCKFVRGALGQAFWRKLRELLHQVERGLASWCLLRLNLGPAALLALYPPKSANEAPTYLTPADLAGQADPATQRAFWGTWWGRETAFFKACAELVDGLSWPDVLAICGPETALQAQLVALMHGAILAGDVPARAHCGSYEVLRIAGDTSIVRTYENRFDLQAIPTDVLPLLPYFDGGPVPETLDRIERETGIRLDPEFVRQGCDFGLLIEG